MADQSINVTNMPDSGSSENVAFKLWGSLRYLLPDQADWKENLNQSLDLYATCLSATNHGRKGRLG